MSDSNLRPTLKEVCAFIRAWAAREGWSGNNGDEISHAELPPHESYGEVEREISLSKAMGSLKLREHYTIPETDGDSDGCEDIEILFASDGVVIFSLGACVYSDDDCDAWMNVSYHPATEDQYEQIVKERMERDFRNALWFTFNQNILSHAMTVMVEKAIENEDTDALHGTLNLLVDRAIKTNDTTALFNIRDRLARA